MTFSSTAILLYRLDNSIKNSMLIAPIAIHRSLVSGTAVALFLANL